MQRKLLGIINVDFDATGQLLIIYLQSSNFLGKMGTVHRLFIDFKKAYDLFNRGLVEYCH
jgi:hypothetical protein